MNKVGWFALGLLLLSGGGLRAEAKWWAEAMGVEQSILEDRAAPPAGLLAGEIEPLSLTTAGYPVGTAGSDVRAMLAAVRDGKRAEIPIPGRFGDLQVEVESAWLGGMDWDGDGVGDRLLLRVVRVPDLDEKISTVAWLVAVRADAGGAVGPDEEKTGLVLASARSEGTESPLRLLVLDGASRAVTVARREEGRWARVRLKLTEGPVEDSRAARALVDSAALVFDRMVLAPETAYVKAFIRKEFQAEVAKVESVAGLAIPELLRPLYTGLVQAERWLAARAAEPSPPEWLGRSHDAVRVILRKAGEALTLSSEEFRYRVEGLQKVSDWWREREGSLAYKGERMRRIDMEVRISETSDPAERLSLAKAYEGHFAGLYEEGGDYHRLIDRLNDIARGYGYRNFADFRIEGMFGVPAEAFRAWVEEAFAATEADARAFIEAIRAQKGGGELGYWEVSYLRKAWRARQIGAEELPRLTESQAQTILRGHLLDQGFDLSKAPYDRITMDYYEDPLKLTAGGVAATATPWDAYFTSNLKPGEPIPLDEFETMVHETLHTLHYQTAGLASGGSSAFQNLMFSYVAEGIAMSGQGLATGSPALMKRYFAGLPGFTERFMESYPRAQREAEAWELRRLLAMALMEHNLYEDRDMDGGPRTWKQRLAFWPKLIGERLWVVPDGIELGQILCRMHPTAEQQQLQYASYALGRILVGGLRDALVKSGSPEELATYGEQIRVLMARGALADQPFVKEMFGR